MQNAEYNIYYNNCNNSSPKFYFSFFFIRKNTSPLYIKIGDLLIRSRGERAKKEIWK